MSVKVFFQNTKQIMHFSHASFLFSSPVFARADSAFVADYSATYRPGICTTASPELSSGNGQPGPTPHSPDRWRVGLIAVAPLY